VNWASSVSQNLDARFDEGKNLGDYYPAHTEKGTKKEFHELVDEVMHLYLRVELQYFVSSFSLCYEVEDDSGNTGTNNAICYNVTRAICSNITSTF